MEIKNYYDALEVETSAGQEEISIAYRKMLNAYSDDSYAVYSLMSSDECEKIRNLVEEAFSVLGDPLKRKEYDKVRGINKDASDEIYALKIIEQKIENAIKVDSKQAREDKNNLANTINFYGTADALIKNSDVDKNQAIKKFSLDYQIDSQFEQEIENCQDYSGEFLRKIREYKKVTIERLSEMTKISKVYIHYIENEQFDKLPAAVYTRGFIFQYAKNLKLTPEIVAASFMNKFKQARAEK